MFVVREQRTLNPLQRYNFFLNYANLFPIIVPQDKKKSEILSEGMNELTNERVNE